MKDHSYLFEQFENRVVDVENRCDPVKTEMEKIARENGLTLQFNRMGKDGGNCMMPLPDQVNITLVQGKDKKWRVSL
jgi:hypothetical protein